VEASVAPSEASTSHDAKWNTRDQDLYLSPSPPTLPRSIFLQPMAKQVERQLIVFDFDW